MKEETWVVNASPLILLGKLERLDLVEKLARTCVVPKSVFIEIEAGSGIDANLSDTLAWAKARIVEDISVPDSITGWDLGAGENQVLAHAIANSCMAVLDDGEARSAAKVHSLSMVGTLGILLRARQAKLIPAARPLVEKLLESGSYLSPEIVQQALSKVGE